MALSGSVVTPAMVTRVEVLSSTFVRIEFGGGEISEIGTIGPAYDQRIKLIFPNPLGELPPIWGSGDGWYEAWTSLPDEQRGAMRTYSIRELHGEGPHRRLVVDFVLHLAPGSTGPAAAWASQAVPGDQLIVVAPRRGVPWGGIEFAPGEAKELLLAGDETAVPAMARILADLPDDARGAVYLEVPHADDRMNLAAPAGMSLRWLVREGAPVGTRLIPAVTEHFGAPVERLELAEDVEPTMWETPGFSGAGEDVVDEAPDPSRSYAWIAGESAVVTTIRRHLVREAGLDRRQVAFMGYWRLGVAMRG